MAETTFDLHITFAGLNLLVEDLVRNDGRKLLHVLTPGTGGGHHGSHGHVQRHLARLIYDPGHEVENGPLLGGEPRRVELENRWLDLTNLKLAHAREVTDAALVTSLREHMDDVFDVGSFVGGAVPRKLLTESETHGEVLFRVTMGAGEVSGVDPGLAWIIGGRPPQQMAITLEWVIRGVTQESLILEFEGLNGNLPGDWNKRTLYPIEGRIHLWVFHSPADEMPPKLPPDPDVTEPDNGETAPHFQAFYTLVGAPVPIYRRPQFDEESGARGTREGGELAPLTDSVIRTGIRAPKIVIPGAFGGSDASCIKGRAVAVPETQLLAEKLGSAGSARTAQPLRELDPKEEEAFRTHIKPEQMILEVERYSGVREVGAGKRILSRDILHKKGNVLTIETLEADLKNMSGGRLRIGRHGFVYNFELFNVQAVLPARGRTGTVILSAHLDSYVDPGLEPGHSAADHAAPGADDDASGIAAVLCAARAILQVAATTGADHREIRFVFFNAEEYKRAGSLAYVEELNDAEKRDMAVFQVDMIGHDGDTDRIFELHAGYTDDSVVESRSLELAELVAAVSLVVSGPPALDPRVYISVGGKRDPAQGRSDHTTFHRFGVPACLVCQHFYGGPSTSGSLDKNPGYHRSTDTVERFNSVYAADIARSVAVAAWLAATR